MTDQPWRPPIWLLKALGPIVRGVLRSPLHPVASGALMLLSYTGRASGRAYTIAVGYFSWPGGVVVAFTSRRWWTNLRDGRPVRLLLRGRWVDAVPEVAATVDARAALLAELVRLHGPRATRRLFLGLPTDRMPTSDQLREAAVGVAAVSFRLLDGERPPG